MLEDAEIHLAAHLFQPARLTLARELRGMTKNELAARVERSASAISQFETARTRPDARTLLQLALGLGVPPGFLAHPSYSPLIPIESCHFRSLRSASQRARRRLLAHGVLLSDLVGVLEEHVEFPKEQITASACSVASMEDIEQCALVLRRAWGLGLGPIAQVVQLLESKGVIVCALDGDAREVDAFCFWSVGRPFIFLLMDKGSTSRTRFDAAHELGHLVMHADVQPGNPDAERQANRFAAAFLLPRESFVLEAPTRLVWGHLLELKRRWKVSIAALVRRARDLGRLSEASYRRAFVHLNRTGQRTQEPDEPPVDSPQVINRALQLLERELPRESLARALGTNSPLLSQTLAFVDPVPAA